MKAMDWVRGLAEAVLWYFFIMYFLYAIKNLNEVNLWVASLILIAVAYAAMFVCPWLRHTTAWRRMTGKEA